MGLVIRQADLLGDQQLIIQFLLRHLTKYSDDRRYDWLYLDNPHGEAAAFLAEDSEGKGLVGVAAAFPRRMMLDCRVVPAWVLGDFCMDPRYRTLGPALQLQRACLRALEREGGFCYDFPSQGMMAIYSRLKIPPLTNLVRMTKPLRTDRKLRQWLRVRLLSTLVAAPANELLRWIDPCRRPDDDIVLRTLEGPCRSDFDDLALRCVGRKGCFVERSADYLNWRYLRHPIVKYEMLAAWWRGRLEGYLVFSHQEDEAWLVDWFGSDAPGVLTGLVIRAVRLLRNRKVATLSAPILEQHPWRNLLVRLGFRAREATPMVVCGLPRFVGTSEFSPWFIMQGDRDS